MNQNDKDALKAARLIKAYCNSIDNDTVEDVCKGCIFNTPSSMIFGCKLSDPFHLPETWDLEDKNEQ